MSLDPKWAPCGNCGCIDGQASFDKWEITGALELTRTCPRRLTDDDSYEWIAFYKHYKAGHLLNAGGVADQPATYFEAMNIISTWVARENANT